ncbi:hypothetical protein EV192_11780 [Actinocrispum wychmicini]|uniref:Uncharacterized protein n=1 Tax=Actinocrispum wychmicini TaxID=1213861 RepID=A0A4V2S486_9PSEU|nr:hypothetical protein EV192_11780 [Actinocrispum wychmicini]
MGNKNRGENDSETDHTGQGSKGNTDVLGDEEKDE